MAALKLFPIAGINNVSGDDGLQRGGDDAKLFVRDALNVDISDTGRIALRKGVVQVSATQFKHIWQSPLHKDVFATLGNDVVLLNTLDWSYEKLGENIVNQYINYQVVNNLVYICTDIDLYVYDGFNLKLLNIQTPEILSTSISKGRLPFGNYVVAVSFVKEGRESGLSNSILIKIDQPKIVTEDQTGQFDVGENAIFIAGNGSADLLRVYITSTNGSVLRHYGDFTSNGKTFSVTVNNIENLGVEASFENYSSMPTGRFFDYWNGRLIIADKNIICFSEPMAYHLHDEKYGFVMLPQRITFIIPVDSGIWVGQVDHVVFLSGSQPGDMSFVKKTAHAPVPSSAIAVDTDMVGSEISQGGSKSALWLSGNGYVLGTASGQIIELHAGVLQGIAAKSGRSVRLGRRIVTALG